MTITQKIKAALELFVPLKNINTMLNNDPKPHKIEYRIIETVDGKFFPQLRDEGTDQWFYLNRFYHGIDDEEWFSTYTYECKPINLSKYCYSKNDAEAIIIAHNKYYNKLFMGSGIKNEYRIDPK